jgi:hypothetical protein
MVLRNTHRINKNSPIRRIIFWTTDRVIFPEKTSTVHLENWGENERKLKELKELFENETKTKTKPKEKCDRIEEEL